MLFKGSMRRKRPEYHGLQRLTFSIGPATILKISPGEITDAGMVELADAQDLGSCAARRVGSTPTTRINKKCDDMFLSSHFSYFPRFRRSSAAS